MVYPPLYEGFGLPVAEAMACGTAVVTSNLSSLPEVAGAGALYVDPTSVSSICDAMEQVLTDTDLCGKLGAEGRKRAELYRPAKTAKLLHEVYLEALGNPV